LHSANNESAKLDAEILLAHCLRLERTDMLLRLRDLIIDDVTRIHYNRLIERRKNDEPIAYIIGEKEFWSLTFEVGSGVLIPRPDSEVLIETACTLFDKQRSLRIADLGTGPGTLLLAALSEFPAATGIGIDMSDVALGFAERNAERFDLSSRAEFRKNNWLQGIADQFDLILCNPPYIADKDRLGLMPDVIKFEPELAFFGGPDGLDAYRTILPQLAKSLTPTGIALLEIGFSQAEEVIQLAEKDDFYVELRYDLAGRARCCVLTYR
jgi:release factor glutamine methyltransferase